MTSEAFRAYAETFAPTDGDGPGDYVSPYDALRRLADVDTLRQKGTFFTASQLASELWEPELAGLPEGAVILDPASGAGDLVMPVVKWAAHTDTAISIRLNDVEDVFLPIARSRLLHAAESVTVKTTCSDFLADTKFAEGVTHLALNPPYFSLESERVWGSGRVSAAAVFVEHALRHMKRGSTLLAVLPDVLRSGSRYGKWRDFVESTGAVGRVAPWGQFDSHTDIHVFLLTVRVGCTGPHVPWVRDDGARERLQDHCEVRVGPVVPHRDADEGPTVPYLTAKNLATGKPERRRFAGRLERGPLVLVNRTSRPGDRPRLRARILLDTTPSAVENHLLVVKPLDGTLQGCETIVELLGRESTWEFLDERIRCRHLTVSALKEIPWRT